MSGMRTQIVKFWGKFLEKLLKDINTHLDTNTEVGFQQLGDLFPQWISSVLSIISRLALGNIFKNDLKSMHYLLRINDNDR